MPTNKEIFNTKMTALANSINTKAGTTGAKGLDALKTTVDSIVGGIDTSDATAYSSDILFGKTAYARNTKLTGTIPTKTASDLTAVGSAVSVPAGYYANMALKSVDLGSITIHRQAVWINPDIQVESDGLIRSAVAGTIPHPTADITPGYISAYTSADGEVAGYSQYQLPTQAAQTITPTTSDQTIASGTYLTGTQTIKGDANLAAANIAYGVTIFGVTGTFKGSGATPELVAVSNVNAVFELYEEE